jgi:hypothetical protein
VDQVKREQSLRDSGTDLFAGHIAVGLGKEGDRITSVEARHVRTGLIRRFKAPVFIDATGDGWLGFWSGAGISARGANRKTSSAKAGDRYGELWSPEKPDMRVMGTSVLWNSQRGERPTTFPAVPWAMPVAKDNEAVEGEWFWEYFSNDLNQVRDAERIRDHLLRGHLRLLRQRQTASQKRPPWISSGWPTLAASASRAALWAITSTR